MNAQKLITRDTNYKFAYPKHENQIYRRFTIENFKKRKSRYGSQQSSTICVQNATMKNKNCKSSVFNAR